MFDTVKQARKDIEPADKMAPTKFIRDKSKRPKSQAEHNIGIHKYTHMHTNNTNKIHIRKKNTIHQLVADTSAIQFYHKLFFRFRFVSDDISFCPQQIECVQKVITSKKNRKKKERTKERIVYIILFCFSTDKMDELLLARWKKQKGNKIACHQWNIFMEIIIIIRG